MKRPSPHPFDVSVGQRLRAVRRIKDVSQAELGDAVGLTFQQIQKYEQGHNRISASMLFELAKALEVSMGQLLGEAAEVQEEAMSLIDGVEAVALLRAFQRISSPRMRREIINFVEILPDMWGVD